MGSDASATPFAKALFDVALSEGRTDAIGQELATVTALFRDHEELRRVLTHPAVQPRAKREIVGRIATQTGASVPMQKLLGLMADRDRLGLLPKLEEAYQARLLQHQGVVEAHVVTAVPLAPAQSEALARGLSHATGKQVRMTTATDPGIMGGVVARLGSRVFDGSLSNQLERVRQQLIAGS